MFYKKPRPFYPFITLTLLFTVLAGFATAGTNPHPTQLRPGFMTGDSDVGSDFYLDVLIPIAGDERSLFFFNPNFRFDDNDGNEQNIGFGYRLLGSCGHFILGGNAYYDTMKSESGNRYRQWGVGAELLSQWVDLRANYYDVFGDDKHVLSGSGTGTGGYFFSGNSLFSVGGLNIEQALDGFDAEISVLVPGLSDFMETRLAATYFQFDADQGDDPDGWRARLDIRPVRAINLSIEYRDDDLRGSDSFVGGYLEIPFSLENLFTGKNPFAGAGELWSFGSGTRPLNERMTDKVIRDRHIVTVRSETGGGGEGQAVVDDAMIFVSQDNPEAGDGTFLNPYQTLGEAADDERFKRGAWIYVFSSESYYYDTQFTLLEDQVFWGQGYEHPVYGLGGGDNPVLDGGGSGRVITLANNNEVMGFTVQNGETGIRGDDVMGTNIHDNIIRNHLYYAGGIYIGNFWEPADIDGKSLEFNFVNNQLFGNVGAGIYLFNNVVGAGKLQNTSIVNTFADNTAQGNAHQSIYTRIYTSLSGDNSFIAGSTFSNSFTANTVGGSGEGQGNRGDGLVANIELFTNGATSPIRDTALTHTFEGNTVVNNGGNGISDDYLYVYTGGPDSGLSSVSIERYITDNEVRDNRGDGYNRYSTQLRTAGANSPIVDSSIGSQIGNNTISGNGYEAIDDSGPVIRTDGTDSPISRSGITNAFSQNRLNVSAAGSDAINIYTTNIISRGTGSGLTDVSIDNIFTDNIIDGAGTADDGIEIPGNTYIVALQTDSPIANARISNTFEDNTVTNFAGDGLYFPGNYIRTGAFHPYSGDGTNSPISGSTINNTLTNNIVTDNGGYGIYNWRNEIKSNPSTVSSSSNNNTYTGNTVDRNGDTGIYLDEDFGGGANTGMHYTFTNNNIRDNGGDGLYLYIDPSNGELMDRTLRLQGNTITGNDKYGVELSVWSVSNNDFKGDFGGGDLGSTGGNTFSDNVSYDIHLRGNSIVNVWALNNTWTNNNDPESTICDGADSCDGDIITSRPE